MSLTEKHAEDVYDFGEAAYRTLFEQSLDGMLLLSPDGSTILGANAAACEMFGMSQDELRSKHRGNLFVIGPDYAEHAEERERTGRTAGEATFIRKDGSRFAVDYTSILPRVSEGRAYGLVMFRNITDRKRTEASLRESEERLRHVVKETKAGYFLIDREGCLVEVNDAWLQIHGYDSAEEVIGRHFSLTQVDADLAESQRIVESLLAGEPVPAGEFSHRCRDGSIGYHTFTVSPVVDHGEVVGLEGFLIDTTEHERTERALQAVTKRLELALRSADAGTWDWEVDTGHVEWSTEMFELFGLDPETDTASFECWRAALHPQDAADAERRIQEALAQRANLDSDYRIVLPGGEVRWINAKGVGVYNPEGRPVQMTGICLDITRRKRIEDEYRTLFSEMLDGFALHEIICDDAGKPIDYRFLAINPAFERMTGLKAEDVVGRTVLSVLPGTERSWIETYGEVALTGRPAVFENFHSQLNKHFTVTAYQPAPRQFACIFADVTERKRAEEALRESEAKMRGILDNIRVGVALISPRMEILELNPVMREWFPRIDTRQTPICYGAFNHPPRETVCEYCPTIKTLEDGRVHEATTRTPVSGGVRNYRVMSSPVFDPSGKVTAAIEMVEDVTERLALEFQLQQSQKMESVGRLAGGVAHDFNNMLGVILGHAEMALEQTDASRPLHVSLQEIKKAAERSAQLTGQLLAFARKQTVTPRVININETVAGMLKMLERLIGEDIRLEWQPEPYLWPVRIDPSQVGQMLTNLCVNARDAIAGVGRVTIATRNRAADPTYRLAHASLVPGEYVELTVSDNGCGMDAETMARLFEPFFTTKGIGEGTGLGLATVYGIVRQNGGIVEAESELGKGSTLTIYLPRHGESAESLEAEMDIAPPSRGHETILLVEDEPALLSLATTMLENQGYTVVAAGSPGEAIRLAREHPGKIHLLITDVVMPEMNGRDLAKNLLSLYPDIKRLFMSGYTSDVIAHRGVLEEGVNFLQKPFSSNDLGGKVRAVLDSEQ